MAATAYLSSNPATPQGNLAIQIHDFLNAAANLSHQLSEALNQSNADDPSGAAMAVILGTTSSDNAQAIRALVGSVNADLNNGGNAFLQYMSRVNRSV